MWREAARSAGIVLADSEPIADSDPNSDSDPNPDFDSDPNSDSDTDTDSDPDSRMHGAGWDLLGWQCSVRVRQWLPHRAVVPGAVATVRGQRERDRDRPQDLPDVGEEDRGVRK